MKQAFEMDGNQQEYRNMVKELCELDSGLTEFEVDFIESLSHWSGNYTKKQVETLEKLWRRHL